MRRIAPLVLGTVLAFTSVTSSEAGTLRIWRDCSSSMSEADYATVVETVLRTLQPQMRIDQIELVRFSCGNVRLSATMPDTFSLVDRNDTKAGPLAGLFVAGQKAQANISSEARAKVLADTVKPALLATPDSVARCTRFDSLARRISEENRPLNMILTDGWVDCRQTPLAKKFGANTIIIVIPKRDDEVSDDESLLQARMKDMERFFPGATIVKPFQVTSTLTKMIGALP